MRRWRSCFSLPVMLDKYYGCSTLKWLEEAGGFRRRCARSQMPCHLHKPLCSSITYSRDNVVYFIHQREKIQPFLRSCRTTSRRNDVELLDQCKHIDEEGKLLKCFSYPTGVFRRGTNHVFKICREDSILKQPLGISSGRELGVSAISRLGCPDVRHLNLSNSR